MGVINTMEYASKRGPGASQRMLLPRTVGRYSIGNLNGTRGEEEEIVRLAYDAIKKAFQNGERDFGSPLKLPSVPLRVLPSGSILELYEGDDPLEEIWKLGQVGFERTTRSGLIINFGPVKQHFQRILRNGEPIYYELHREWQGGSKTLEDETTEPEKLEEAPPKPKLEKKKPTSEIKTGLTRFLEERGEIVQRELKEKGIKI